LILAKARGYFEKEGLDVKFNYPKDSNKTGHELFRAAVNELTKGTADVIIGGVNTVIYYNTHSANSKVPLIAISALTNSDGTAIATPKENKIDSLKKLEGKKVGVIGFAYEEGIVKEMVKSEGGNPTNINFVTPPYCHLYDGLKEKRYDAAHICIPWHGIRAKRDKVDLTMFKLEDYGIPRHFPCLVTLRDNVTGEKKTLLRTFLKACQRGYSHVLTGDTKEIAKVLTDTIHDLDYMRDTDFLEESLRSAREYFKHTGDRWGMMKEDDWKKYVRFLAEKKLLVEDGRPINEGQVNVGNFFTNELLPSHDVM